VAIRLSLSSFDQPCVTRGLRWIGALGDAGRQELKEIRMELGMEMPTGPREINGLGWVDCTGGAREGSQYQSAPANPSREKGGFLMGPTRKKIAELPEDCRRERAGERVGSQEVKVKGRGAKVVVGGSLGWPGTMENIVRGTQQPDW
jgi:hypothetical protein